MSTHQGKTVLVTGAGGGLGRVIAEKFVVSGANVVVCDINKELLADWREKVESANSDRVLSVETDITSETALDDLFEQTEKRFGHFDYVINSAGVIDRFDPAGTMDRSTWDKVIAVNLTAPMSIIKRGVNSMLKAQVKGSIVNIASVAAFKGFANGKEKPRIPLIPFDSPVLGAAYTASKAGLIGLTKNTAAFYRLKGIRCNAIAAGAMQTNIGNSLADGRFNMEGMGLMKQACTSKSGVFLTTLWLLTYDPVGEWEGGYADLNKMATLVAFLCSEEAEMINGATVTADGGITAN
ncbi:3-beta-hydroxycholanate 3-dehydrogenase (NAD(+)) 2 [Pseudocercospora fuligena]|uniref:3-beta-hydroxycholanate 3-dehydrogenase (NAD(+)) 2 n=1 Tax=Pseudocercospora fuligena TaxID=685502 RepID=A0A8H6RGP8_9PEZI|nr:3-beta-hydroxycholanate 3-dehydrogenase (NAD(+)) 2 [Pseudocercospora fuligena]